MSWRIAVWHRTGYRYAGPVQASYNEARLTPPSVDGQRTLAVLDPERLRGREAARVDFAFRAGGERRAPERSRGCRRDGDRKGEVVGSDRLHVGRQG